MGTGLLLGLVLPSPALQGVGWPGLRARQEPGAHVSPAGVGAPGGGRLSGPRGDFHEWWPGRAGEACLGAAYSKGVLQSTLGSNFFPASLDGALAIETQQGYQVGKSLQSRGLDLLATECPLSLILQALVPEGQGICSGGRACPPPCCPWCLAAEGQLGDFLPRQGCWPGLV